MPDSRTSLPILPIDVSHDSYYRIDYFSEHLPHPLETTVGSFDGVEGIFGTKFPGQRWHTKSITVDEWSEIVDAIAKFGFWTMPESAPPRAIGGGAWRVEASIGNKRHVIFRINPELHEDEKAFMEMLNLLRRKG